MTPPETGEPIDNAKLLELVEISVMAERRWLEQSLRRIGNKMLKDAIQHNQIYVPSNMSEAQEGIIKKTIECHLLQLQRFPCGRVELHAPAGMLDSFQIVSVTIDP